MPPDEIRVWGRRPPGVIDPVNPWFNITPDPRGPFPDAPGGGWTRTQQPADDESKTFLPPAAAPRVIEEIIVKGKRRATLAQLAGRAFAFGSWALAAGSAIVGLDQYRRQLEKEADERSKIEADNRRLRRLAAEQPLPEIIVTAEPPVLFAPPESPYVLPPLPQIFPREADPDPWIMQPIIPRTMPARQPVRIAPPVIAPPEIPVRPPARTPTRTPLRIPTRFPQISPSRAPATRPAVRPAGAPATSPAPSTFVSPAAQVFPGAATTPLTQYLTGVSQRMQQSMRESVMPLAQAQAQAQQQNCRPCKPCKKDKDKPRNECWRKLVKESRYPRDDKEYKWVEIDCFTGRELDGPSFLR